MYTLTTHHSFGSIDEAIKDAVKQGFEIEFLINDRGFTGEQEMTYLPESVVELEVIIFTPKKKKVLYLLKMVDGMCGWMSDFYGVFAGEQLSKHLTRIKENFVDEL